MASIWSSLSLARASREQSSPPGGLIAGRWDAEKGEFTIGVIGDAVDPEAKSGLSAGRWNPDKKRWEQ